MPDLRSTLKIFFSHSLKFNPVASEFRTFGLMQEHFSICILVLQYNWLMRMYVTPEKLSKNNDCIPDSCIRCGEKVPFFPLCLGMHQQFWWQIKQSLETIPNIKLVLNPKLFILGLYPERRHISRKIITGLDLCLLLTKRVQTTLIRLRKYRQLYLWRRLQRLINFS